MDVYLEEGVLEEYRAYLLEQRSKIVERAAMLRTLCLDASWKDDIYEKMREIVNMHFRDMDKLLSGMDDAVRSLDKMIASLERYFLCIKQI